MSRVRTRDTAPEMYVRRRLWHTGYRYRLSVRSLPGRPDIVVRRLKVAVFVHGCFWHSHDCPKGQRPATNREIWDAKLDRNVARDNDAQRRLTGDGWRVFVIWECALESGTADLLEGLWRLETLAP